MHVDELARFVASLAIPAERKDVVLAELTDHLASAREAAVRAGRDPEAATIGDLEALRRQLEAVEPAFRVSRWRAIGHGLVAGLLVAFLIDLGGVMYGPIGAVVALAIIAACAPRPSHALALLRRELRGRRLRGSVAIGPMLTYFFTIHCVPATVWVTMIFTRAIVWGVTAVEVPFSAIAYVVAIWIVVGVEMVRARRPKAMA